MTTFDLVGIFKYTVSKNTVLSWVLGVRTSENAFGRQIAEASVFWALRSALLNAEGQMIAWTHDGLVAYTLDVYFPWVSTPSGSHCDEECCCAGYAERDAGLGSGATPLP